MPGIFGRQIFHCDCNAFFASVEEVYRPELRRVPMAVAGDPESRHGIILAKNELAKKFKVQTAEAIWSAKQKCPGLVLVPPRREAYSEFSERVNAIYEQYSPYVERFGIDESFIDMTGGLGPFGGDWLKCADEIRLRVKREIDITISIGISWNKIFAKLGSDYKKPDAVTAITRENWKGIVFPLPAGDLFFVGKKTSQALSNMGVRTIGDLAGLGRDVLYRKFGKAGEQLYINANGLDQSPVLLAGEGEAAKSIGSGFTFKRDLMSESDVKAAVAHLSGTVALRLRKQGLKCRVVQVAIKGPDLKSITRQATLARPSYLSSDISKAALMLIGKHWPKDSPIRALTITGEGLNPSSRREPRQLSMFEGDDDKGDEKQENLEKALDIIRERYGGKAVIPGSILGNDLGIDDKNHEG